MAPPNQNNEMQGGLVDGPRLLEQIFPNPVCRPSIRWLRARVAERTVPYVRIGRLCFFDPIIVKASFDAKATVRCQRRGAVRS
jgi:hypothetical protein